MVNIYCSAFGLFGVVKNFTTQELKMKFQIRQFRAKGYAGIPQRKYQTRDRKQQSGLILTLRLNSENILHTISY